MTRAGREPSSSWSSSPPPLLWLRGPLRRQSLVVSRLRSAILEGSESCGGAWWWQWWWWGGSLPRLWSRRRPDPIPPNARRAGLFQFFSSTLGIRLIIVRADLI